jgi:repressor of nif and glnA expression
MKGQALASLVIPNVTNRLERTVIERYKLAQCEVTSGIESERKTNEAMDRVKGTFSTTYQGWIICTYAPNKATGPYMAASSVIPISYHNWNVKKSLKS